MKYHGLHAERRKNLARLLATEKGAITIDSASKILGWERGKTRAFLSSLSRSGWLKLIQPGLYIPVPLESEAPDLTAESELVLAQYLFRNCYIGGMVCSFLLGTHRSALSKNLGNVFGKCQKKGSDKRLS